jgi:hypothetical protein
MSESYEKNPADFYLVPYEVVRIYGDDGGLTTNGIAARNLRDISLRPTSPYLRGGSVAVLGSNAHDSTWDAGWRHLGSELRFL